MMVGGSIDKEKRLQTPKVQVENLDLNCEFEEFKEIKLEPVFEQTS